MSFTPLSFAVNSISGHDAKLVVKKKLKLSDVVQMRVLSLDRKNLTIKLLLETQNNFKIYADKLKFNFLPQSGLPYELSVSAKIPAHKIYDPFSQEEKLIFENGNEFELSGLTKVNLGDKLSIEIQACSQSVCMLPESLALNLEVGAMTYQERDLPYPSFSSSEESFSSSKSSPSLLPEKNTATFHSAPLPNSISLNNKVTESDLVNISALNSNLSYFLQNAFTHGSLFLFPALFLAGLLMNLTPCVYPMIPITLSVMSQFEKYHADREEKKRRRFIFPFIYVGAMVVVYSGLGVFAGMSGNIFGSQLASPLFSVIMAVFMFIFGFAMLGFLNLTQVQNFAIKIPLSKHNPAIAVATMGAVSGLVSAPCTGPVLSMILVLIAKNKDPFSGFLYMLFFALGFGIPYAILGVISQKIMKMPKFPRVIACVKLFFSALMFALGFYFLKPILQNLDNLKSFYLAPSLAYVMVFILLTFIFLILAMKKNIVGKLGYLGAFLSLFFLCMWLTLNVTHSFIEPISYKQGSSLDKVLKNSSIAWQTSYKDALSLAQKSHKPILVDIWADWCVACLEAEKTTWKNKEIVQLVNKKYIAVKLDFSTPTAEVQNLVDKWQVLGLPAIILFQKDLLVQKSPTQVFQGIVNDGSLLQSLQILK